MNKPIIALADCNSFYCSCERLFRPDLANKPVIVLSNNDGCIVSRTDEAKKLGIPMGAPLFKVRDIVEKHNVSVFSSNYTLYGDLSRRVMKVLSEFAPEFEIYSIDEAFLLLTGFNPDTIEDYLKNVRKTVLKYTGIPISIGVSHTKVLAKAANKLAKNDKIKSQGVYSLLDEHKRIADLKNFPVEDIWGIGRQYAKKLHLFGIKNAYQFSIADSKFIQKNFTVVGKRIAEELCGNPCIELEVESKDKKQIISSRSFGRPVMLKSEVKESLANHISTAAEKLRSQDGLVKSLTVFIHTNQFKDVPQYFNSSTMTLLSGSAFTPRLINLGFEALDKIFKGGYEYKKTGVIFNDIIQKEKSQLDLFAQNDTPREEISMATMDGINEFHGTNTVKAAACGTTKFWKMLSEMKSRAYTTRWSDLLKVG